MKVGGIALFAVLLVASLSHARAAECDLPDYLLTSEGKLPRVAAAIAERKLDILVLGTRSSIIGTSDVTSAYPGQMEAQLRAKLPDVQITVTLDIQPKKTAEELEPVLAKLGELKPKVSLVIWQTGTVDAMRGVDSEDFRTALDGGIELINRAGADAVLINLQYSPRTETMMNGSAYLDVMRVAAQQHNVPVFDRYAMMRHWHEAGEFDLFSPPPGVDFARKVHKCLGGALSTFVLGIAAAKSAPAETPR